MTSKASQPSKATKSKQQGYKVWHFALAVPAIAVTLQLMLGSLTPLPQEHNPYATRVAASFATDAYNSLDYSRDYGDTHNEAYRHNRLHNTLPEIDILPLHLRGDMTGPLLASVIEDYATDLTDQHISDLRDTMPPCDNPRMIVILPEDDVDDADKPVF